MNAQQWPQVVSASVAPVVVISACGLLCLAFYNRLAAIISRIRGFQRERLHGQEEIHRLSRENPSDVDSVEWRRRFLDNLAHQTARTVHRARMIRMTLLCLLGTIGLLVLSSIFNGLTVLWPQAEFGAALLYLSGMVFLLVGIIFAIAELLAALDVVESETDLVDELAD
jgi:hypothetical protein